MNFDSVGRATQGLAEYLRDWFTRERLSGRPKLVIAHDTRFFSTDFTNLAAEIAAKNGCDACIFDGPRSTPELSFAVRHLRASAGVVITASHNPPHDNGYKVYFSDGAQVVEPHASGIIAKVNAAGAPAPNESRGEIITLGREVDEAYMARLETLVLDPALVRAQRDLRIVFTPIHGTGGVIIKPMLERLGFTFDVVAEQDQFDGRFPTVQSPNPENAEALSWGSSWRKSENADLVIATDPDCDRMGVAVRSAAWRNEIADRQPDRLAARLLPGEETFRAGRAQRGERVARRDHQDVRHDRSAERRSRKSLACAASRRSPASNTSARNSRNTSARCRRKRRRIIATCRRKETRRLRLAHSSFYIFGGEESYGYSGADFVRDKDGNGAAIMFCEVAAYAKSLGLTIDGLLDQVYAQFGYYLEKNGALTFEGAEGAAKIQRLLATYVSNPPNEMLGSKVTAVKNFETDTIRDVEGDEIPKEKMLIFELADRTRVAVRGSGTEPKIKYYLFAQRRPDGSGFTPEQLKAIKTKVGEKLEALWEWLQEDAQKRIGFPLTAWRSDRPRPWSSGRGGVDPSFWALLRSQAVARVTPIASRRSQIPIAARHPAGRSHNSLVSEIKLNGGEITILKTLGLSGGMMAGAQLADRMDEMEGAEFLDTLAGLDGAGLRRLEQGQHPHDGRGQDGHFSRQSCLRARSARRRLSVPARASRIPGRRQRRS